MSVEVTLQVNETFSSKYKEGYPLIHKEALKNSKGLDSEGTIVTLVDENKKFIGKGYYGRQNKGYGWVISYNRNESFNQAFFKQKLAAAIQARSSFYQSTDTTAFRVFNGEGDGIGGFTLEYFDGYYLFNWYSKGIYTFQPLIIEALKELVEFKGIYEKKRFHTGGQYIEDDEFVAGERGEFPLIVKENDVNFAVYFNEGAMVGVFLDQRNVRQTILEKYSKGRTVLNTFSYTGAFSVFAALGGAAKTTSVDLANRSLNKTIEQFSMNEIDYEAQDIIVEDVFKYFKYAVKKELTFDTVILDPPSFARSKKFTFSASKGYKNLLKEAIAITENGGTIVASTNCSSFGMKKFKGFIKDAFKEMKMNYQLLEEFSLPSDFKTIKEFKEGDYLKVVFIKKIDK
ncbi:class I SAM-dependent rRNA methyltransferase [Bacillus sp. CGMCC 1.16541]|uniref:class I SAM-dependent rRNA methyltransferase n=1 Tax=Bacillus sp. CGMCC 1.16541 TaxID=2185143 RepID=UPI000D738763|nr:class I SAM-dependent rRNA methyltransferase [Bacillus sp. CGMCC 1.16541]